MITWEKAASCQNSQCIAIGRDLDTEGNLIYIKSDFGNMTYATKDEFRAFIEQAKNGEWDHI